MSLEENERARLKAIFGSPAAKTMPRLADVLAYDSELPAAQAVAMLEGAAADAQRATATAMAEVRAGKTTGPGASLGAPDALGTEVAPRPKATHDHDWGKAKSYVDAGAGAVASLTTPEAGEDGWARAKALVKRDVDSRAAAGAEALAQAARTRGAH